MTSTHVFPSFCCKVRHLVEQSLLCSPLVLAFKQLQAAPKRRLMGLTKKKVKRIQKYPKKPVNKNLDKISPLKLALEVGGSHFAQNLVQNENHHHKQKQKLVENGIPHH